MDTESEVIIIKKRKPEIIIVFICLFVMIAIGLMDGIRDRYDNESQSIGIAEGKIPSGSGIELFTNVDQVIENIDKGTYSSTYPKELKIIYFQRKLKNKQIDENGRVDKKRNTLVYKLHIKNTSKKALMIKYRLFLDKEVVEEIVTGAKTYSPPQKEGIQLEAGQSIRIKFETFLKQYSQLNRKELTIFEQQANVLYLDLMVDGNRSLIKMEKPNTY